MRIGSNPNKDIKVKGLMSNYSHRVILPLYIPTLEGYHKDSLELFKICLSSVLKTTNSNDSSITIVNNGCCKQVVDYLNKLFDNYSQIEIIHTQAVGKLNAILKGVRGSNEPYITITDADVLFKQNWLNDTIKVFNSFPKAGVVGIVPQFKMYENFGFNVIFDLFFSKKLQFRDVLNPKELKHFYKSIGWDDNYNKAYLEKHLTIKNQDCEAIVGSGHFVATYKREIFDNNIPFSNYKLGGGSEGLYLDKPCLKKGLWRLTTADNNAFHMGNVLENWMNVELANLKETDKSTPKLKYIKKRKKSNFMYVVKNKIFPKIFKIPSFKRLFYRLKGLSEIVSDTY